MGKTSGMQAYAERYAEAKAQAAQMLVCQYMQDTLQLALHQTEGWGYERIVRLCDAWQHIRDEYRPAINPSDPAADVMQGERSSRRSRPWGAGLRGGLWRRGWRRCCFRQKCGRCWQS